MNRSRHPAWVSILASTVLFGSGLAAAQVENAVDVGGHKLFYQIHGHGTPTVVVDVGVGESFRDAPDVVIAAVRKLMAGAVERAAIERAIRDCIGWAKNKDFKVLYGAIAGDADFLEVHPDGKVVKGIEEFKKAESLWRSPDFKAVRYEIHDLKIKLSKSGDVAWFFCLLDDINEWKGKPASWENTRWTGVLEKRAGRWVMAQQHFSFARDK